MKDIVFSNLHSILTKKEHALSVNHDYWGTTITYFGYFLLFFSMVAILFTKHSRFGDLKTKIGSSEKKKAKLITILVLLLSFKGFAQDHNHDHATIQLKRLANHILNNSGLWKSKTNTKAIRFDIDSLYGYTEEHAAKFGRLIIQDAGGRMKPINTFSSELLRKVSHSDTYNGMNSDQVFLSMTQSAQLWIEIPLIYIKSGNDSIRKIIGIDSKDKYAPFIAFFDEKGNYKLSPYLDEAYKAANPNQFEKDFVETDKKVNLMESALSGSILRIFPIPNDAGNKWISYLELEHAGMKGMDSTYTKSILPLYFGTLANAIESKNYKTPDELLESINGFQKKFGSKVRPSEEKIDLEIAYNKYDLLQKLPYAYLLAAI